MKAWTLDSTKSIEAVLGAIPTTNPVYAVVYTDFDPVAKTRTPGSAEGSLTGTTTKTIVPAPSSGVTRIVSEMVIMNVDTAAVSLTVKLDVSATEYELFTRTQSLDANTGQWVFSAQGVGGASGTMSSWTLTGDSGTPQTISDGNTVDIAGGTSVSTVAGATNTVTVSLDCIDKSEVAVANETTSPTTNSTSFSDVDGAGSWFTLTMTTTGRDVLVLLAATVENNTNGGATYFDLDVDSVAEAGDDGMTTTQSENSQRFHSLPIMWLVEGLSAASHTFTVRWKVSGGTSTMHAGDGTSARDVHPQLIVKEIT
jgi:hypothetical protein